MIKIIYALKPDYLQSYTKTKDDIISERAKYKTAEEIELVKSDVLKNCQINDLVPGETLKLNIQNDTAIIPIQGMLVNQVDFCAAFFGETVTTYSFIQESIRLAEEDESIKTIIFDINSGGGYVEQCEETFQVVAGCSKKTYAIVHDMAASAAYWLAAGADEIISVSKTGLLGSIGVAAEIINRDKAEENKGIRRTVVTNDDSTDKRPDYDTEEGMQVFKDELNAIFNVFMKSILVKRGNKLSEKSIKDLRGRIKISEDAINYGLADKYMKQSEVSDYLESNKSGGKSEEISTYVQKTTPEGDTEEAMNFEEFLATNPDAKAAYKAALDKKYTEGVEAGKEEMQGRINATVNYIGNKDYPGIEALAKEVLEGKADVSSLKGAVTAYDMMNEKRKSDAAKEETKDLGDQPAGNDKTGANPEKLESEADAEARLNLLTKGGAE